MSQQVKYCPHRRVIGQSCAMCREEAAPKCPKCKAPFVRLPYLPDGWFASCHCFDKH